jgi:cell wall-associated NlpC family hydrolase
MAVNAGHLLLVGGGGVFVWSGITGHSVSSVFRQLAGGDSPTDATKANSITGVAPIGSSAGVQTTGSVDGATPASSPSGGPVPAGAAGKMLSFMESKVGHPYSEDLSLRRGPTDYDCSGLVWAAAQSAGINIPAAASTTLGEAPYFAAHGWKAITNESQVQTADVCFFVGADPVNTPPWGPIGHVGMCSTPGTLVSAYDTAKGVCYTPMSQDGFVVAFRSSS